MICETEQIKVKAICLFRNNNMILVSENWDTKTKENYYRPLGGKVEFGEHTIETIKREIKEELGSQIVDVKLETICENIFVCDGLNDHEIMYIYDAKFLDQGMYLKNIFEITESDGSKYKALWININEIKNRKMRLVPEPLNEYLGI